MDHSLPTTKASNIASASAVASHSSATAVAHRRSDPPTSRDDGPSYKDQTRDQKTHDVVRSEPSSSVVAVPFVHANHVTDEQINSEERARLEDVNRQLLAELQRQRTVQQPQLLSPPPPPIQPKLCSKYGLVGAAVLISLAAATAGIYCGTGNCRSPEPTTLPSAPVPARSAADAASILSFINNTTLSKQTLRYPIQAATPSNTAEERALQWLIDVDLDTAVNDTLALRQRYVLAIVRLQSPDTPWSIRAAITSTTDDIDESWLTNIHERRWTGVGCDGVGNVDWLDLWVAGIQGGIPGDLGLLTALTRLWLSTNELMGTIPTSLGLLTALTDLWLDNNALSGTIPSSLVALTDLSYLTLHNNRLLGSMPFCDDDNNNNKGKNVT